MEKTISFSILKEKIIKTDELLAVVLEKNKSLEKSQKWNQHLKTRLELTKNEVNKLKLRNETLSSNLILVEKNYSSLKNEHTVLKEQYTQLGNESSNAINTLQVNYQLVNKELQNCQKQLSKLSAEKESVNDQVSLAKGKKSPVKRKRSPVRKKDDDKDKDLLSMIKKIKELQTEKEKLIGEKTDLKLEVYELRKKLNGLKFLENCNKNKESEYSKLENELIQLKSSFKSEIEKRDKEIDKLIKEIKIVEKQRDFCENDKLKGRKSSLPELILENGKNHEQGLDSVAIKTSQQMETEISELKNKLDAVTESKDKEIEKLLKTVKNTEEEREKIFNETERLRDENCSYQVEISMLQENSSQNREENDMEVEPQDERCRKNSVTPTDDEIALIMKEMSVPSKILPLTSPINTDCSPISANLKRIVTTRRNILKKRRKQIAKKRRNNVDLYGTLLALKKAKINFIISSDSVFSPGQRQIQFKPLYPKSLKVKQKPKIVTISKELNCTLPCCNKTYMVLNSESEDAPLLGFVGVKNEISANGDFKLPKDDVQVVEIDHVVDITGEESRKNVQKQVENDEGYQSNQSESAFSSPRNLVGCDIQSKVRRSNRKSGSLLSVIKKKKVSKLSIVDKLVLSEESNDVLTEESISREKAESTKSSLCDNFVFKKPTLIPKSPKTAFKRPVCSTRRSQRLVSKEQNDVNIDFDEVQEMETREEVPLETPKSPTPESEQNIKDKPVVIPLEKVPEHVEKMQPSKIEVLFNKLILYSEEEEALNEVVREFAFQEPDYIAEAILERVTLDVHDRADTKHSPAPLMTDVQRTLLGFMSKLEKSNVIGVFDSYLSQAAVRLLTCQSLQEFEPITRLYLAVCKLQKNLTQIRKLCCDVFYFCGDLAVPFFFTVLTSWTEVLPPEADAKDFPLARVLVQIVYMKDCNKPGYNLMPLRDLLIKFYGYPTERWDCNEFFKDLFDRYLKNPTKSSDFALLLFCKNRPEKWVYEKIEEHLKPLINLKIQDNFKATLIVLISNLYNRFSSKSEVNYLPRIREWLTSLVNGDTPDVIKRCVYVSLIRLKKK